MENKKFKIIFIAIVFIAILILAIAVWQKPDSSQNIAEKLEKENIVMFSPNADYKIYNKISSQMQFYIDVFATEKINEGKLSVKMDGGVDYKYNIEQVETDLDTYLEYKIYVTITNIYSNAKIENIDIEYNHQKYQVNVGNIQINSDIGLKRDEKGIDMKTISTSGVKVRKNKEGIANYLDAQVFTALENITIKDIRLFRSTNKIQTCNIMTEKEGKAVNQEWKGKTINIPKGSTVGINLDISNSKLKNNSRYQGNEYIVINYQCNNKDYCTFWEVNFDSALKGKELWESFKEDVSKDETARQGDSKVSER